MIHDFIGNLTRYSQIPFLKYIERFIAEQDCANIRNGEIEILGRDLFVRIADYETGSAAAKQFEAHTVYADFQFIASGAERMDVSLEKMPQPVTPYDEKTDIRFFKDPIEISSLLVSAGQFAFFFPGQLHKPGCDLGGVPQKIKKLVFKIRMMPHGA